MLEVLLGWRMPLPPGGTLAWFHIGWGLEGSQIWLRFIRFRSVAPSISSKTSMETSGNRNYRRLSTKESSGQRAETMWLPWSPARDHEDGLGEATGLHDTLSMEWLNNNASAVPYHTSHSHFCHCLFSCCYKGRRTPSTQSVGNHYT